MSVRNTRPSIIRPDRAFELAQPVLQVQPDNPRTLQVIGLVHARRDEPEKAIPILEAALAIKPDMPSSQSDLGMCYFQLGDAERAVRCYERALAIDPGHASAQFNRALAWLKQGRFRDGWVEYEWRFATGQVGRPEVAVPRWDGAPLNGRSILIHTEQGMGDVFQFVRFLPLLKRQGGRIIFACQKALHKVLQHIDGVDEWYPIDEEAPINFDLVAPLASLPLLMQVDRETDIPQNVPYVRAEPERIQRWDSELSSIDGFKVGLCWQGSKTFRGDGLRSIPLSRFTPLNSIDGVSLVSLQKGFGEEQIAENSHHLNITELHHLDEDGAFIDTAAVIQNLDLVITSDTVMAHLAGAMGKPVWVLLGTSCDWRFLEDRDDSPWYPTMRLFRQNVTGDWSGVFREVADALRAEVAEHTRSASVPNDGAVHTAVSFGELIDKITILEIKAARIDDDAKVANVRRELTSLEEARDASLVPSTELQRLTTALRDVNEQLWDIEDDIRRCEASGEFGDEFVQLARAVYQTNDQRATLKREISEQFGSNLIEEKSYVDWGGTDRQRMSADTGSDPVLIRPTG